MAGDGSNSQVLNFMGKGAARWPKMLDWVSAEDNKLDVACCVDDAGEYEAI